MPKARLPFWKKPSLAANYQLERLQKLRNRGAFFNGWQRYGVKTRQNRRNCLNSMKEVSLLEMIGRSLAKVAAGAGIAAVLIWLTYVMLDVGHMQSGFTLPQSSY